MIRFLHIFLLVFFLGNAIGFAQETELKIKDTISSKKSQIDPLAPARAAFYSAVLPGLGQAYNKKYWKIPIVYGALGTGIGIYAWNNSKYHEFRDAYKRRIANITDVKYSKYSNETLINAQSAYERQRDISLIVTVALYALNIVDANVDAHLKQFNVDDNLSLRPDVFPSDFTSQQTIGLTLNYRF
ncbi:DUF5683 domain-containing protein [Flavobacterium sp.]|uniref:DUF5683 domain-containing protein n=1 Tax=Flavobacterium sp. TaxID=239 RepID=UPI0037C0F41A